MCGRYALPEEPDELLQGVLRTPEGKRLAEQIADAAKRQSETK